ncbi:MAG: tRNA (adenosine(37)-N6)-threonylcarbamoyltransferase complex dimerization subunit type 1 TsaB [Nitratireductor sp.]
MKRRDGNSAGMNLLAIDTSAHLCAAAVLDTATGKLRGKSVHDIGRGHSEKLMDVIGEALSAAGLDYSSIGRIACSTGPGSFTGVRVGLATARGIALGLSVPVIGIGALEASSGQARQMLGGSDPKRSKTDILAVIEARRGEVFAQFFSSRPSSGSRVLGGEPVVTTPVDLAAALTGKNAVLCGSGAGAVNAAAGGRMSVIHDLPAADISFYARLALDHSDDGPRPEPLYLRPADAKPQYGFAIPRI